MSSPSPNRRRIFFRLGFGILIPVAFFALLEGGLRYGGFGRDPRFFIPDEQAGYFRTNPRFTELYFPASFGLKPLNFRLAAQKPDGAKRVFVLGESAAMGVPEPAFSLAPQLRAQLQQLGADVRVEVHNLGVTAINSHAVVGIAREAVGFDPDLLVIYMGNNEVVGPYGAGSVVTAGTPPRWLIRAAACVGSTRTGQLVRRVADAFRGGGQPEWGGMEMFANRRVAADDPRLGPVHENFRANLEEILGLASERGIPVVLSTVAVNVRDCAPFASVQPGDDAGAIRADLEKSARAVALGRAGEAEDVLRRVAAANPQHAEASFRLARVLDSRGETGDARRHYLAALQLDALRFRADARINELIRAAARPGVRVVDAARELGSAGDSTNGPAGREYFFEHVHLTWEGTHALARLIAREAAPLLWPGREPRGPLDSDAVAARVGFTPLGRLGQLRAMEELTARPPFTGQFDFGEYRGRLEREIAKLDRQLSDPGSRRAAAVAVDRARQREPGNPLVVFQAAHAWMQAGESSRALGLNDHLATLVPPSPEQAVQRAYLLQELGRTSEAEATLLRAIESDPNYLQAHGLLARLWVADGRTAPAVERFSRWAAERPANRMIRSTHARLLAAAGNWDAAEREWAAVLELVPDDETVLGPFVERLARTGRIEAAVGHMLRAHAYNPRSFPNNARLVQVFEERNDPAETVKYMRALAASGPVNARLHLDLARLLAGRGHEEESLASLHEARRAAERDGDAEAGREVARELAEHVSANPEGRNR